MTMCTLTYQNFAPKFLQYAHFPANFAKFQIFAEQLIFVVQRRQPYEKAFILDEKLMEQELSNLLKY